MYITLLLQFFSVMFSVAGSIDPWHALSVLTNQSASEVAIFIPGTSHCANMLPDSPDDPPALCEARKVRPSFLSHTLKSCGFCLLFVQKATY